MFDVDATILDGMSGRVLRPLVRETFAELVARGRMVVLWSAGGEQYAQRKAADHALDSHVAACFGKDRRSDDGTFEATGSWIASTSSASSTTSAAIRLHRMHPFVSARISADRCTTTVCSRCSIGC